VGGGLFSADPGSHLVVAHLLDQVSCFALGLGSALQLAHLRPAAITRTRLSGRMAILPPGTDNRLCADVARAHPTTFNARFRADRWPYRRRRTR